MNFNYHDHNGCVFLGMLWLCFAPGIHFDGPGMRVPDGIHKSYLSTEVAASYSSQEVWLVAEMDPEAHIRLLAGEHAVSKQTYGLG